MAELIANITIDPEKLDDVKEYIKEVEMKYDELMIKFKEIVEALEDTESALSNALYCYNSKHIDKIKYAKEIINKYEKGINNDNK